MLNDKYKSSTLYIPTGSSGQHNELFNEIQPDLDIKNLVMEQNTEHLYEHRKLVASHKADVGSFQEDI